MKPYQKFIAGAAVLGTLAGCAGGYNPTKSFAGGLEETVRGVPISVQFAGNSSNGSVLSAVIKTNEEKYFVCSAGAHYPIIDLANASALIKAGIKEGTQIEIKVHMNSSGCFMDYVSAYGHKIDTGMRGRW